jgi:hypothetical protein
MAKKKLKASEEVRTEVPVPGSKRKSGPGRPKGPGKRGPGRPKGSGKKGPGRPAKAAVKRGPGRPKGSGKKGPGRPRKAGVPAGLAKSLVTRREAKRLVKAALAKQKELLPRLIKKELRKMLR